MSHEIRKWSDLGPIKIQYKDNSDMIIFLIPAPDVIVLVSHPITIGLLTRTTTHCPRHTSNNQLAELILYLSLKRGFFQMLPGNYTTTLFQSYLLTKTTPKCLQYTIVQVTINWWNFFVPIIEKGLFSNSTRKILSWNIRSVTLTKSSFLPNI